MLAIDFTSWRCNQEQGKSPGPCQFLLAITRRWSMGGTVVGTRVAAITVIPQTLGSHGPQSRRWIRVEGKTCGHGPLGEC